MTYWYDYDDETGMEYEHDGVMTRRQWHDGVGLVTEHRQSFADFINLRPNAMAIEEDS